jgi:multiple sugar transport system substrate-binding protein
MSKRIIQIAWKIVLFAVTISFLIWIIVRPENRTIRKYPDRREVRFWHMWTGQWKEVVERIVNEFNESQDQYEVVPLSVPGAGADSKLLLSVAGGNPPDTMAQWNCVIPAWATRKVIQPLDSFMTPEELKHFRETCYPVIWKIGEYDSHFYGLCCGLNVRALYYRPSHFIEAGLDPDRPPKTISELDAMAEKLTRLGPDGKILRAGFIPDIHLFWSPCFGASFYDLETKELTIDTPQHLKVLQWIRSYRIKYGLDNIIKYEAAQQSGVQGQTDWPFITGAYSMVLDGQWRVEQLARYAPNLDYRTAPLPMEDTMGLPNAGYSNGNFMVIPSGAKCPQGAWEFMKFWSGISDPEKAATFYTWGGWLPINESIVNTKVFRDYQEKHPQWKTFVDLLPSENLHVSPPIYYQNFFIDRLWQMGQRVSRLIETPEEGIKIFSREIEQEQKRLKEWEE